MEAVASPFSQYSFPYTALCALFILSISIFLFSVLHHLLRSKFWCCRCEICSNYLFSGWSREFRNLCDWYTHLLQNSPAQTIHIHVLANTITANPENVEYILKTRFENYPKGRPFSMILGDLLGNGIFNVDGDSWLFQRKMASLELASMSIRNYAFEIVTNEIKCRLLPLLSSAAEAEGGQIDLQDVFRRFSFDNICKFSFGLDPGCLESSLPISIFAKSFDLASELCAGRALATWPVVWKIKRLLNIGTEKRLKEAIGVVDVLANELILQKRKLGFSTNLDLLSRFMSCITDDQYLRDIIISFILAGRDTVASALTTFFWLSTKMEAGSQVATPPILTLINTSESNIHICVCVCASEIKNEEQKTTYDLSKKCLLMAVFEHYLLHDLKISQLGIEKKVEKMGIKFQILPFASKMDRS